MPQRAASDSEYAIGFLLVPQFSMMAFVSAIEPLRVANRLAERRLYRWDILSRDGQAVAASNGMALVADRAITQHPRYDMAIVCASFTPERYFDKRLAQWLRRLSVAGIDLGAMDTGSFFLGWAGLLDQHRATTHWESLDSFREQFPKIAVENGLFVIDRKRWTSAGGTATLDMMLHLISRQHGHRLASAVSEQFVHAAIRAPEDSQRMTPGKRQGVTHRGLAKAIELMEAHLEDPIAHQRIAERIGLSLRQLERLFRRHFRLSPRRYYLDLRLQRARSLLHYTDMPMVEIAIACGFASAAHFSRSFSAWSGNAPTAERRRQRPDPGPLSSIR